MELNEVDVLREQVMLCCKLLRLKKLRKKTKLRNNIKMDWDKYRSRKFIMSLLD